MADHSEGKEMWLKTADADGWISKTEDQVMEELEIIGYDAQKEALESLTLAQNYYDIEFENSDQGKWRFVEVE